MLNSSTVASYTPFFKEAWDRKLATEKAFNFTFDDDYSDLNSPHEMLQSYGARVPTALPKVPYKAEPFGTFGIRTEKIHNRCVIC